MHDADAILPSLWLPAERADGQQVLVLVARQTLQIDADFAQLRPLVPAAPADQLPVQTEPRYDEGQPPEAPVTLESDLVAEKPAVDVLLLGHAIAPQGKPAPQWPLRLQIGARAVEWLVLGPRAVVVQPPKKDDKIEVLQPPQFGPPAPIASLPLSLRYAYGGTSWWLQPDAERALAAQVSAQLSEEGLETPAPPPDQTADVNDELAGALPVPCPTNPYGKGYCLSLDPRVLARLQLPQLEDPVRLLTPQNLLQRLDAPDEVPLPAATSAVPRHCLPRAALAGVLPSARPQVKAAMEAHAAQLDLQDPEQVAILAGLRQQPEPPALQAGFWNCAPPALQWPAVYPGDAVAITGMHPDGPVQFVLPHQTPLAELTWQGQTRRLAMRLDTLVLEPQRLRVSLVWRAALALDSLDAMANEQPPQLRVLADATDSPAPDRELDAEGTRIERQPWQPLPEPATNTAQQTDLAVAQSAAHDALPLGAEGSLLQTADTDWEARLPAAVAAGQPAPAPNRAAEEHAALAKLAAAQQTLAERRAVIATALAAGKPVPPKDHAKSTT